MKLGIDAGHGGGDPGALDPGGRRESEFTLSVALCVASFARARGHLFYLSRTEDVRVPNRQRAEAMNEAGVDLVVAIHWNAKSVSMSRTSGRCCSHTRKSGLTTLPFAERATIRGWKKTG